VVNVGEMAATIGNGGNDTWWEGWEKVCATPSNTNNYRSSHSWISSGKTNGRHSTYLPLDRERVL
jgi:hypothetical protein